MTTCKEHLAARAVAYADQLGIYAVPVSHGGTLYWAPRLRSGNDPGPRWVLRTSPTLHGWKSWATAVVDLGEQIEREMDGLAFAEGDR